jgi:hypothetical protein
MESTRNATVGVKVIPVVTIEFRGAFRCCGEVIPNPTGLPKCPKCGTPAVIYQRDAEAIMPWPFPANIFFAVADWLNKLAKKLERFGE